MNVDGCDILNNNESISEEDRARERLERKRAAARRYEAKKRAQNPDAAREYMREYMRNTGKAREYYRANKETCLLKSKIKYAKKKAKKEDDEEEHEEEQRISIMV